MYIEVKGVEEQMSPEEQEYHEHVINTFKGRLEDELEFYNSRFPHITLVFRYNRNTQKFKELEIPINGKITFERVKLLSNKLKRFWE